MDVPYRPRVETAPAVVTFIQGRLVGTGAVTNTDSPPVFPPDKNLVYTNWGRSAVEAAVRAEGLEGGSMMLPAFICQESFEGLYDRLDLTPVFVDIDPVTYHIDLDEAAARAPEADAVLLVHSFGLPADMDAWTDLCETHDLTLVENCVRALGAEYDGQVVGSFGTHAVYSLYKVSTVSMGGVLASDAANPHEHLAHAVYDPHAIYHGLPESVREYFSLTYPVDYDCRRLDEVTRRSFERFLDERFEATLRENRRKAEVLRDALGELGLEFQPDTDGRVYYKVPALVPEEVDRDALVHYLTASDHHLPVTITWANPWAKSREAERFVDAYPNTSRAADRVVCFEVRAMDDRDVAFTIEAAREFFEAYV